MMVHMVLVLSALCAISLSSSQDYQDLMMIKRKRLQACGDQLTQSLMIICDHKYNKRTRLRFDPDIEEEIEGEEEDLWKNRRQALVLLRQPRLRRGVVDECCSKSCSINELSSYCAPP